MIKTLQILLIIFFYAQTVNAQRILVSAPSHVAAGENFRISYTINTQNVSNFRAGNIPAGLEVIAGPYTSQQSSYQIINGHTSGSSSITYTYTIYADKNGSYNISPARAHVNGKNITSKAIHIKVSGTARNNGGAPRMHTDEEPQMRAAGSKISGKDLFVKVSANKREVHEQEPILLTYKVYTLVDLTSLEGKMPDLTGFHTQEIKLPQQKSFHIEKFNGRNYRCVTWSQYVMYPQMTGKMRIPSITFKGIVVQQNRSVDPFEAFFNGGSGYVEVKRNITAPGLDIVVDPLPKKPAGFSGGVGKFNITAQANHLHVKAGDPVTIRVVVSGVGNLKLMKQPVVVFPKDFDKYDPKITDKTKLTTNGIEGNMIYDYLAVPRNQGKYTIPAVVLTYFDTSTNSYKTIKTQPITLNVAKGDGKTNESADFSEKDQDIHPLKKGDTEVRENGKFMFGSLEYWIMLLLPLIVFGILVIIFRQKAIENADVVKLKGKHANKIATKRLKKAYDLMLKGKQDNFYDEVLRALWGYVSDKLNIPVESLSKENISEELTKRDITDNTINTFISALDECEFERYAPGDVAGNMNKTYSSAMTAIMDIENSLKSLKTNSKGRTMAILLLMIALPLVSNAATKNDADKEYAKGNYQQAITDYQSILKKGVSPDIYYNLGNAYYRTGNITQSIIAYERALKLSPGDNDIRFNLQFVSNKTIDKITPQNDMFFVTWYRSLVNITSVDGWGITAIVSFVIALLSLLLFLFTAKVSVRKCGFYGAIIMFVLFVVSNIFAYEQKMQFEDNSYAIVISPAVGVKATPADNGNESFIIHEGTKVHITDRGMKGWIGIELADGREGWIKTSTTEEI